MPSIKLTQYSNVISELTAAFSGQAYPVNVTVANVSRNLDVLPVVGGIIDPEPGKTGIVIALASATDLQRLGHNINRLCRKLDDSSHGFVVETTSLTVSTFGYEWKKGVEWYGDTFKSFDEVPDALAYGIGVYRVGSQLYVHDGDSYSAVGAPGSIYVNGIAIFKESNNPTYSYNPNGTLNYVEHVVGGVTYRMTMTYNADGTINYSTITYSGNTYIQTMVYTSGQLTSTTDWVKQ